MNKKIILVIEAAIGFISLFLPWYKTYFFGNLSLMSLGVASAYILFILFVAAGVLPLINGLQKNMDDRLGFAEIGIGVLTVIVVLWRIIVGGRAMEYGITLSFGAFIGLIAGAALAGTAIWLKFSKGGTAAFNKNEMNEATQKGLDAVKSLAKNASDAAMNVINNTKDGINKKTESKKENEEVKAETESTTSEKPEKVEDKAVETKVDNSQGDDSNNVNNKNDDKSDEGEPFRPSAL